MHDLCCDRNHVTLSLETLKGTPSIDHIGSGVRYHVPWYCCSALWINDPLPWEVACDVLASVVFCEHFLLTTTRCPIIFMKRQEG